MLGSEQLGRLRGNMPRRWHASAGESPIPHLPSRSALLARRINPDAWVTEDDVRRGRKSPAVQKELARHVGHRRRRRRRRRPAGDQPGQPTPDAPSEADSEPETEGEEEEDEEVE
jgi:hypothetical protein